MTFGRISREQVPAEFNLEIDRITPNRWLEKGNGPLARAMCKILDGRSAVQVQFDDLLRLFTEESEIEFDDDAMAREAMAREWKGLWENARMMEVEGVVRITTWLDVMMHMEGPPVVIDEKPRTN